MKIKSIKKVKLSEPKQYYDVVEANPYNNFLIKSNSGYIVSHNCSFEDEINFASMTTDVEKIKAKAKHLISQVDARMQSRFMKGTKLPTLNIIASSKTSDQSFLDSYINTKKKNNSKTTLIIDEPQWVVRNDKDSPIKFWVAVGNKFLASEILPQNASEAIINSYRAKGYQMLQVPIGYWEAFNDNVELALTDIAGISTTSALKYISGIRLNEIKTLNYSNPFTRDIIEVGTGDKLQYSQFFNVQNIPISCMRKPLYIHLDMSKSGDKTGIAGVWIMGKRPSQDNANQSKEAYYRVAFSVSVKAPKGYEISFEKNRTFIRWLKSQGLNIKGVTMDTYQSAQIKQQLIADGFNAEILSVDRLDNIQGTKTKICLPYAFFKSAIYEHRLELYNKCDLLTDEIVGLEKEPDGHVNHPEGGTQGCFTGDTKVRLVDGRSLSFLELEKEFKEGKVNYVYSFNEETQRIEAKPIINAWCTGKNIPIMKVVLDNGEEIRCTLNHKFMNRDGSYTEAKDLKHLDSMMPLYTKLSDKGLNGYRLYYEPMEDKWHYEHRQFAVEVDDEKYLVHHKDCNKLNNSPDNLIWMSKKAHLIIHHILSVGCNSEGARKKRSEKMISYHQNRDEAYFERNKKIKTKQLENGKGTLAANYREDIVKIDELFDIDFNSLSRGDKLRYRKSYNKSLKEGKIIDIKANMEQREEQQRIRRNQINSKKEQSRLRNEWVKAKYGLDWNKLTWGEKITYGREYKLGDTKANIFFESVIAKVPYEALYNYYIVENHNGRETCEYFNINSSLLTRLFKYYNIKKDKNIIVKNISDKLRVDYNISYNDLYNYYIIDNHNWEETYKHFGVSGDVITKLLKNYGIKKDRSIINKNISEKTKNKPKTSKSIKNHRIAYVEFLDEIADVYDITVQGNHNFALDAGIFVHNSKDQSDAVAGALYNASQHIEQYAFDYGEDIDDVLNTNTLNENSPQMKQQINIDFEKALQEILMPKSIKEAQEQEKKTQTNNSYNNIPIIGDSMLIW